MSNKGFTSIKCSKWHESDNPAMDTGLGQTKCSVGTWAIAVHWMMQVKAIMTNHYYPSMVVWLRVTHGSSAGGQCQAVASLCCGVWWQKNSHFEGSVVFYKVRHILAVHPSSLSPGVYTREIKKPCSHRLLSECSWHLYYWLCLEIIHILKGDE